MLIPVLGPWLALPDFYGNGTVIAALLGTAQAAGLVTAIVGGAIAAQPPSTDEPDRARSPHPAGKGQSSSSVSFGVSPTRDGAFGFASGRF
jgi:hypothetical protein